MSSFNTEVDQEETLQESFKPAPQDARREPARQKTQKGPTQRRARLRMNDPFRVKDQRRQSRAVRDKLVAFNEF